MKQITFLKRAAMLFMAAAMVISCSNADEPVIPTTIEVTPHQHGFKIGYSYQLTAKVTPTNMGVTWSSSNNAVVTVDNTGKITAVDDGTATITATTEDGKATDKCEVTVAEIVINIDKETLSLKAGKSGQITATTDPEDAPVTWESSDETVATVDQTGKVTAVKVGTANITAKAGKMTATCVVTVSENEITLNKHELTLKYGKNEQLIATTDPTDLAVTWESSNTAVATVDQTGKVTALKAGTADIFAKSGEVFDKCVVTVPEITITLNLETFNLEIGKNEQLIATVDPDDLAVTWESSDATVATVVNGKVNGLKLGTTTITAKAGDKSATCAVTVTAAFLSSGIIYVVGYERVGSLNIATLWKDGVQTRLSKNMEANSTAEKVFVVGNDVYVAGGLDGTNLAPKVAGYWKNGTEIRLTNGATNASANGIYVSGGNVYVGGYENVTTPSSHPEARLWKDGQAQQLQLLNNTRIDNRINSAVHDVFVADGHVYACGYDGPQAAIWVDGQITHLTPDQTSNDTRAYKILVSDGKVYAVGYYGSYATIWVDNVETRLTTAGTSRAHNLFISNGDVYVTGYSNALGGNQAMLWKNGVSQNISLLPFGGGTDGTSQGYSVFVWQGDVYMAGHEYVGVRMYGKIWKGDESPKIFSDGQYNAYVRSIFITPNN